MPKMTLSADNKQTNSYEYPKLFLEKGERARIVLIEDAPHYEWVNTLRAPELVNGQPIFDTVTDKNGQTSQVMKYRFVGRHISVGNPEILAEKGYDDADPVSVAGNLGEYGLRKTERRFAINVIRYKTKPGSFEVSEPFQPELLVWSFGEKIFSQLVDYSVEWGDLKQHDLLLGPCEAKQFQKFDINVAAKAEWLADEERKKLTAEVYKHNRIEDLSIALGRRLTRDQVTEDLNTVIQAYQAAHGIQSVPQSAAASSAVDLSEFNSPAETAPSFAQPEAPAPATESQALDPAEGLDLDALLDI